MNGGRTQEKWLEIEHHLVEEGIDVYALTETHLRDLEEPPVMQNYVWEGCNRTAGARKGGGVGMLVRRGTNWQRVKAGCKEHLWLSGTVAGKQAFLGVVYLWTGSDSKEQNNELVNCLKNDINEFSALGEIILVGDMNAHIDDLDGYTDYNGSLLLNLCEEQNLIIVNRDYKCEGQVTWQCGNKQSCIDYGVLSESIYERLDKMAIDEDGSNSLGSDHKRLIMDFGKCASLGKEPEFVGKTNLTDKQIANIARNIESKIERCNSESWDYNELIDFMQKEIEKEKGKNTWKGSRKPRSWWNSEIKQSIAERKKASREHREAKRLGLQDDEVALMWNRYREKKLKVQNLVQAKIKSESERWVSEIRSKKKGAPKAFWNHIRTLGTRTKNLQTDLRDEDGKILVGDDALLHMHKVFSNKFSSVERSSDPRTEASKEKSTGEEFCIENLDWKKAEQSVPRNTAAGPDGIPISLINQLGPQGKAQLIGAIEQVINTKKIPTHWRKSRMNLIYKGKGDKTRASSYRPVTVTSVVYRMAMQAIKTELLKWVEGNNLLGELQNGFRPGRRLEDNLFVLTQCMEISMAQQRPLWLAFLDIEGAYDNIDQDLLWEILEEVGVNEEVVELLREIYKDNQVQVTWEGRTSRQPVHIHRGLKQGCPLSPLLFTLYVAGMERRLEGSKIGFDLSHSRGGQIVEQSIPGLMYADDIVLLADNAVDLQRLADICGEEATRLGLSFSTEKSGIMLFNCEDSGARISIQQKLIHPVKHYKYLGVTLSDREGYLGDHEVHLKLKGRRNAALMKHRALWGFNKYEVVRGIWKAVMVPALTFSNAVLCLKSEIQSGLEINQRAVGRLALGAHGKTTNEAVQGDMGWASFEVREAQSKIGFEERLRNMDDQRWAARVHKYLYLRSVDTQWRKRTRKLATKYRTVGNTDGRPGTIKKKVKETETATWAGRMATKKSLEHYKAGKREIAKENFYDNTKGSALLFEARAGCLRTRSYIGRYRQQDESCICCGKETETIPHILMDCESIHPVRSGGNVNLLQALGFKDNGNLDRSSVEISKRRLECWWKITREQTGTVQSQQ